MSKSITIAAGLVLVAVAALLGFYFGSHNSSGSKSSPPSTPDPNTVTCTAWLNLTVQQKNIIAKTLTSTRSHIDDGCGTAGNPDGETASEFAK